MTVHGRVDDDGTGAVIVAWIAPHWIMIVGFIAWVWVAIKYVQAPIWFIAVGLLMCVVSFQKQKQKVYEFLREASAA